MHERHHFAADDASAVAEIGQTGKSFVERARLRYSHAKRLLESALVIEGIGSSGSHPGTIWGRDDDDLTCINSGLGPKSWKLALRR